MISNGRPGRPGRLQPTDQLNQNALTVIYSNSHLSRGSLISHPISTVRSRHSHIYFSIPIHSRIGKYYVIVLPITPFLLHYTIHKPQNPDKINNLHTVPSHCMDKCFAWAIIICFSSGTLDYSITGLLHGYIVA